MMIRNTRVLSSPSVAAVLERLPVITPYPAAYESAFSAFQKASALRFQKPPMNDWAPMTGSASPGTGSSEGAAEDNVFATEFRAAPRLTQQDSIKDSMDVDRKLANRLYFVVKKNGKWTFPLLSLNEESLSLSNASSPSASSSLVRDESSSNSSSSGNSSSSSSGSGSGSSSSNSNNSNKKWMELTGVAKIAKNALDRELAAIAPSASDRVFVVSNAPFFEENGTFFVKATYVGMPAEFAASVVKGASEFGWVDRQQLKELTGSDVSKALWD
ncbi:mitochondrial ribosomal protein L46 (mL46) [Andalucia godoyi]|uniref:Mitochondrial ribosomal protein L46 (ML46) n=1 Tax=Andalucia godoyi TaxID=505711 RepID=A0A8K0AH66_ANDGO|nr:mitochondrial ribosomal protein L46 (mL46) [Andalucia godoyi]|eukprot:ANDGO_00084.mRNA.1 mitochondrial ribosomal protein L46 (mL46)